MAGVNKVILLGRLGKDPEVRALESGNKMAKFSLATNRYFKGQDGQRVEETDWHHIVLWGNQAELAEKYLAKGNQVYIEGRLKTRSWDDQAGVKHYTTEVIGESITFIGGRPEGAENGSKEGAENVSKEKDITSASAPQGVEDDLPF